MVTYVDKKSALTAYPLQSVMETQNVELQKRLRYTKDILVNLLSHAPATGGSASSSKDNGPGQDGGEQGGAGASMRAGSVTSRAPSRGGRGDGVRDRERDGARDQLNDQENAGGSTSRNTGGGGVGAFGAMSSGIGNGLPDAKGAHGAGGDVSRGSKAGLGGAGAGGPNDGGNAHDFSSASLRPRPPSNMIVGGS